MIFKEIEKTIKHILNIYAIFLFIISIQIVVLEFIPSYLPLDYYYRNIFKILFSFSYPQQLKLSTSLN